MLVSTIGLGRHSDNNFIIVHLAQNNVSQTLFIFKIFDISVVYEFKRKLKVRARKIKWILWRGKIEGKLHFLFEMLQCSQCLAVNHVYVFFCVWRQFLQTYEIIDYVVVFIHDGIFFVQTGRRFVKLQNYVEVGSNRLDFQSN